MPMPSKTRSWQRGALSTKVCSAVFDCLIQKRRMKLAILSKLNSCGETYLTKRSGRPFPAGLIFTRKFLIQQGKISKLSLEHDITGYLLHKRYRRARCGHWEHSKSELFLLMPSILNRNTEPAHVSLKSGQYFLGGSGGVSGADTGAPTAGKVGFKVASPSDNESVSGGRKR